jgi:AcrR family transcriptional regulator
MTKKEINQRNKEESKQKLIDAVGQIILNEGFKGIGINAIAKQAGLDKVLIYRYFDGLDGLLRAFARQKDFYINISETLKDEVEHASKNNLKHILIKVLNSQFQELLSNKELQEFMLWEMLERNELTIAIAKEREEKGYQLSSSIKEKMELNEDAIDTDAIIAVLVSGLYYLALRSRTVDIFNGVELNNNAGWKRIEKAIETLVDLLFKQLNN